MARILVVDDEESIREILGRRLTEWGHEVTTVASADAALEQMAIDPFPIMFCDVMMPVHDGLWLLEQVRQQWPQTVAVMVSGAQEFSTVMKVQKLGAADYVSKPIGREMLHQALERALVKASAVIR